MKDISKLTEYIGKFTDKVIQNVSKAQRETAEKVWEDIVQDAPMDTGNYVSSIKLGDTVKVGDTISTEIYTNATVSTMGGKTYNLGYLLENGTSPHLIEPVVANVLHFQINGEDIFAKRVYHPGTIAQPHFIPALMKNKQLYKENIKKAVKEAKNG